MRLRIGMKLVVRSNSFHIGNDFQANLDGVETFPDLDDDDAIQSRLADVDELVAYVDRRTPIAESISVRRRLRRTSAAAERRLLVVGVVLRTGRRFR